MIIVKVSYSIFSSFLTSDHLFSFSYLAITGTTGYTTVYVKNGFAFVCDITNLSDISDFTLNWLGSGILVSSVQDGISRGHTVYKLSKITDGTNEVAVTGSNALKIDGTVASTQSGTWNITNISGTVSLPTGASTSALQLTGNTSLSSIDGKTPVLGQTTMDGSSPVVIASNQTVIPVSDNSGSLTVDGTVSAAQSGTWNITNISGTVSLPTGAATESSLSKLTLSQGSATSGQSGTLIQGAVTTSSPSYNNTQTSPLSLNTSGGLRVDGSGVTQPISDGGGSITVDGSGNFTVIQSTGTNLHTVIDSGTVTANIGTTNGLALDATLTGGTQTTRITDGTNTVSVKAASTAAIATDKALVVAVSPNNSVAVTQNTASNLNATVVGNVASGATVSGNPVLVAGQDGTNARTFKTDSSGSLQIFHKELATFTALATDIAIGNNKSMFSIVNASGSTVTIKISSINIINVQTSSITGVIGNFDLRRIVNHSSGTNITAIETLESSDSLNGSVTIKTGATVSSEATALLWRVSFSSDEWVANAALDTAASSHLFGTMFPIWKKQDFYDKRITLKANEGLTVKFTTNSTAGTFDIMVVFTQE